MSWDTHNRPPPYKLTIPQLLELLSTSFNPNAAKQWICISIGSVVMKIKSSFVHIDMPVPLT
eukprot:CCRYP_017083-RA/>CCRYP_017083-RA protein AED:0.39 eAED:0.41 QI:0/-1/0/1/-1/0/1/0/61